jgi:two-component system chemotaxis sensor kinase CheA
LSAPIEIQENVAGVPTPENPEAVKVTESKASGARSIKVDTGKLDYLVDMVGEMVIAQSLVKHDPDLASGLKPRLARNLSQLARITDDVQRTAMSMRMIPIGQLFQKTGRLVRDLSRKYGKQVDLDMQGEDTELDRNIVEELADPLMHMVRNAIDHGIEMPEDRVRAGKPASARLTLKAGHQAGHIIIQVSDDGRGLDHDKILRKAREKKLIAPGAELSESEIFNLIFQPGFSTAEKVTDVSGRGVGMDVVRKQVQKLRGRVDASSVRGQGTSFLMKLPLTLAIIDGLVVGVGQQRYIVPIFAVREMLKPAEEAISTVQGKHEMAMVRGALVPVVRLHERFRVKPRFVKPWESLLIVSESGGRQFCLMVDELIGKQEVVIKSLGETMRNIRGVAGGAILGDGRVGLILDLEGLLGASQSE